MYYYFFYQKKSKVDDYSILDFFFNSCCFTSQSAQIIKFCATNTSTTNHLNAVNQWAVNWKNTLNTLTVANLAYSKAGIEATARAGNTHTFIGLNTLACAFFNFHIHL